MACSQRYAAADRRSHDSRGERQSNCWPPRQTAPRHAPSPAPAIADCRTATLLSPRAVVLSPPRPGSASAAAPFVLAPRGAALSPASPRPPSATWDRQWRGPPRVGVACAQFRVRVRGFRPVHRHTEVYIPTRAGYTVTHAHTSTTKQGAPSSRFLVAGALAFANAAAASAATTQLPSSNMHRCPRHNILFAELVPAPPSEKTCVRGSEATTASWSARTAASKRKRAPIVAIGSRGAGAAPNLNPRPVN